MASLTENLTYTVSISHSFSCGDVYDEDKNTKEDYHDFKFMEFKIKFMNLKGEVLVHMNICAITTDCFKDLKKMREHLYTQNNIVYFDLLNGHFIMSTTPTKIKFSGSHCNCDAPWSFQSSYDINSETEKMLDYMITEMSKIEKLNH
jgi:hypothetical protein